MKHKSLLPALFLLLVGVTLGGTLYVSAQEGEENVLSNVVSSIVNRLKESEKDFDYAADLNPDKAIGELKSEPVEGKVSGDKLTAAEFNRVLELLNEGGSGGPGGESCKPMKQGWPDAIACDRNDTADETRYIVLSGTLAGGVVEYESTYLNVGQGHVQFNADGSFRAAGSLIADECKKAISEIEADGRAFNFCGGGSGGGNFEITFNKFYDMNQPDVINENIGQHDFCAITGYGEDVVADSTAGHCRVQQETDGSWLVDGIARNNNVNCNVTCFTGGGSGSDGDGNGITNWYDIIECRDPANSEKVVPLYLSATESSSSPDTIKYESFLDISGNHTNFWYNRTTGDYISSANEPGDFSSATAACKVNLNLIPGRNFGGGGTLPSGGGEIVCGGYMNKYNSGYVSGSNWGCAEPDSSSVTCPVGYVDIQSSAPTINLAEQVHLCVLEYAGGGSSGGGNGWEDVPLDDTNSFDTQCMYRFYYSSGVYYASAIYPNRMYWHTDGTSNWYNEHTNKSVQLFNGSPTGAVLTKLEKSCGGGSASGGSACPSGFVKVGSYCIEETMNETGKSWYEANVACTEKGAQLCHFSEWAAACATGALTDVTFGAAGKYEWIDDYSVAAQGIADPKVYSDCEYLSRQDPKTTNGETSYRCCMPASAGASIGSGATLAQKKKIEFKIYKNRPAAPPFLTAQENLQLTLEREFDEDEKVYAAAFQGYVDCWNTNPNGGGVADYTEMLWKNCASNDTYNAGYLLSATNPGGNWVEVPDSLGSPVESQGTNGPVNTYISKVVAQRIE